MPAQLTSLAGPIIVSAATPLGHVALAVHQGALMGVTFGHRSAVAAESSLCRRVADAFSPCATGSASAPPALQDPHILAADILDRLTRFADGEPVDFSDVPVSLDHLTLFARRVVKACRAIRRGQTRSYGQLAAAAGRPGAARAVGQVMAGNRTPLVVPCHRVVAAGGRLGGFSAPDGLAMKRRLLALEAPMADTLWR